LSLKGVFTFAVGGVLLLFALYLVFMSAQSEYVQLGPLINGLILGFTAFLLLGLGFLLITESAVAKDS